MKATLGLLAAALATATSVSAEPLIKSGDFHADSLAASNAVSAVPMSILRERKSTFRENELADGNFDINRHAPMAATPCKNGKAGEYSCNKVDLMGFLRHQDTDSKTREGNDVWGWTDSKSGREIGILGQTDGVSFAEVNKDGSLTYLGRLPTQTEPKIWRDIKVLGNHAYIGSESKDHGLQIFDMTKLLTIDPKSPVTFDIKKDLTAHFAGFGSSHNIVVNEATNLIAAVGTARDGRCRAGLWMLDVSDPKNPKDVGCVGQDGYVHDAQCVIYKGPDANHKDKEICFNYNEDTLTIVDITDRAKPKQLARKTYNGATYTHQGWLTEDQKYLLLDDELDEQEKSGPAKDQHTTTYIVDVQDLSNPVFTGVYKSPQKSIDHNLYIIGDMAYQANYGSGLRIVDISSIGEDPTGAGFKEAGFFDVHPEDDAQGGQAEFYGAWSVYPYFKSGNILVSSIERGLYSLRHTA